MPPVSFQDFRNIADTRRDATLSVSRSTGNLQIRDNHVLNRLITWVRNKFSTADPSNKYVERQSAYNKFLGAIGNEIRYRDQLGWVEDQFGADAHLEKPLTSRRVREILHELDTRTTEAHRNNLVTAHYMAGKEGSKHFSNILAEKLRSRQALQEVHFELGPKERDALSRKVYDAVMEAGAGGDAIGFEEGNAVTEKVIEAQLDAYEVSIIEARSSARRAGEDAAQKARNMADTRAEEAVAKPRQQPPAAARDGRKSAPEPATPGRQGGLKSFFSRMTDGSSPVANPGTRDLLSQLKKADLPKDVKKDLKKSIAGGDVKNFDALVKQANKKTFNWVCENRFGKWYYNALKNTGAKVGNEVTVPDNLVSKVERELGRNTSLVAYTDIKANVRQHIAAYIAATGADGKT